MQYALLVYAPPEDAKRAAAPIPGTLAALLDRPNITGWARLQLRETRPGTAIEVRPIIEGRPRGA